MKLSRSAYTTLVDEDTAWLRQQPRCIERDHIEAVLAGSVELLYPAESSTTLARLTADLAAVTAERDGFSNALDLESARLEQLARLVGAVDYIDSVGPIIEAVDRLTAERDEALTQLTSMTLQRDVVGRHLLDALQARDEARGLLGEAHHVLDQMHDAEDTLGALKVDVPDDGYPRQRLFDYVTQYGHGLRARIVAHLGRGE